MKHCYKIILYASSFLTGSFSFAQPKLVATLGYGGTKNGGGLNG